MERGVGSVESLAGGQADEVAQEGGDRRVVEGGEASSGDEGGAVGDEQCRHGRIGRVIAVRAAAGGAIGRLGADRPAGLGEAQEGRNPAVAAIAEAVFPIED